MPASESLCTIIGCVGGVLYWIFVGCFFKYFGEEYAEIRYFQGAVWKNQPAKFFLDRREDIEKSREKAGFSRERQVKQVEQLNSNIRESNNPKPVASLNTDEGLFGTKSNGLSSISEGKISCPRRQFVETDSQIQNIDNSVEFSYTRSHSDSIIIFRLSDQKDEEDSSSEEIVMIRRNVGVCHSDNIMVVT